MNSPIITLQKIAYWEADKSGSSGLRNTQQPLGLERNVDHATFADSGFGDHRLMLASWCFAGVDHPSLGKL